MSLHFAKLAAGLLCCNVICCSWTIAADSSLTAAQVATVVNQLSREKTRSQRMAKDFLLAKIGIDSDKNRQNLKDNIDLFDATFEKLNDGDPSSNIPAPPSTAIRHRLEQIRLLWNNYKMALTNDHADSVSQIETFGDPVVRELDRAMDQYEAAAANAGFKDIATVVRTAGRQRMLSQKMVKDICLISLNTDVEQTLSDLKSSEALFEQSHRHLVEGSKEAGLPKTTNKKILDQMKIVFTDWKKFKAIVDEVLKKQAADREIVARVYEFNNKFFTDLDRAVGLYAAQSD